METATVTSKGQITIPISIRKILNLEKGDKVLLEEENGKVVMINGSRHLDMDKLLFASKPKSQENSIYDEVSFEWSDDILDGKRKVKM